MQIWVIGIQVINFQAFVIQAIEFGEPLSGIFEFGGFIFRGFPNSGIFHLGNRIRILGFSIWVIEFGRNGAGIRRPPFQKHLTLHGRLIREILNGTFIGNFPVNNIGSDYFPPNSSSFQEK